MSALEIPEQQTLQLLRNLVSHRDSVGSARDHDDFGRGILFAEKIRPLPRGHDAGFDFNAICGDGLLGQTHDFALGQLFDVIAWSDPVKTSVPFFSSTVKSKRRPRSRPRTAPSRVWSNTGVLSKNSCQVIATSCCNAGAGGIRPIEFTIVR